MALRDEFVPDLHATFYHADESGEPDEHASRQRFRISDGKGGFEDIDAICVVDQEATKERTIVKQYDIYVGDVQIHIGAWYFPRRPAAGEIIYWNEDRPDSLPNQPWQIVDCTVEEGAYVLALYSARSGVFSHSQS